MILHLDQLLAQAELDALNLQLADLPFGDGAATAGDDARRAKNNLQISVDLVPQARPLVEMIVNAVQRNALFGSATLPSRISAPIFNRYGQGMFYGSHVDNALIGPDRVRSDIAVTVFLSRPEAYDGGDLVIEGVSGVQRVKLGAGSAVVYPATSLHCVEPVTRGTRQAAVFWVESMVRDEGRRRILFDLDVAINQLKQRSADWPEITRLTSCYHNLMRMWAGD